MNKSRLTLATITAVLIAFSLFFCSMLSEEADANEGYDENWYFYIDDEKMTANLMVHIVDGKYVRPGDGNSSVTSLIIPSHIEYSGKTYTVTGFSNNLFENYTVLMKVVLPDTLTYVSQEAFKGCTELTTVELGYNIQSILPSAFENCSNLRTISFPDSVTTIFEKAFAGCKMLSTVNIGSGLKSFHVNTAYSGDSFDGSFDGCLSLKKIVISKANPYYSSSDDGLILDKTGKHIVMASAGLTGSYSISNTYTSIDQYAFADCTRLSSVVIPESITFIGERAFMACSGINNIRIETTSIEFGDYPFVLSSFPSFPKVYVTIVSDYPKGFFDDKISPETYVTYQSLTPEYSIHYNLEGGTNGPSDDSTTSDLYYIPHKTPLKDGYDFSGWYMNSDKTTLYYPGAKVTLPNYSVTFTANWNTQSPDPDDPDKGDSSAIYLYIVAGVLAILVVALVLIKIKR